MRVRPYLAVLPACLFALIGCGLSGCGQPQDKSVAELAPEVVSKVTPEVVSKVTPEVVAESQRVVGLGLTEIPVPKPTGSRTHFITFDDLKLPMEQDSKFDPGMLTQRVIDLNNQRVKLRGFAYPSVKSRMTEFPFCKNTAFPFLGRGGTAHHSVYVRMLGNDSVTYSNKMFTVEGILSIDAYQGDDGNTWSIYSLRCEKAY
ncbi:MAG: hypothetical protein ACI9G1_003943 [Pirellulaceae bacterium]|jgi:hypothetical protein